MSIVNHTGNNLTLLEAANLPPLRTLGNHEIALLLPTADNIMAVNLGNIHYPHKTGVFHAGNIYTATYQQNTVTFACDNTNDGNVTFDTNHE